MDPKLTTKDLFVLKNLHLLSKNPQPGVSNRCSGINTRAIADASDLNIYSTRYSLLKLAEKGYVSGFNPEGLKSHVWSLVNGVEDTLASLLEMVI